MSNAKRSNRTAPSTRTAARPAGRSGIFATLASPLRAAGSSAPAVGRARLPLLAALIAATATLLFAAAPTTAAAFECEPPAASFSLCNFEATFTGPPSEAALAEDPLSLGPVLTQAGAHPFAMTTSFEISGKENSEGGVQLNEAVRDVLLRLMPGFAGSPTAVPTCSAADFLNRVELVDGLLGSDCPDSAAVGVVANLLSAKSTPLPVYSAVYNLEPAPGAVSKLGFWSGSVPITIDVGLSERPPYQVIAGPTDIPQLVEVVGSQFTLWGVPADPRHDPLRGRCLEGTGDSTKKFNCHLSLTKTPFLTMPRACAGPLASAYSARSWLGSLDAGVTLTHDEFGNPQGMTGCGPLGFAPEITATPDLQGRHQPHRPRLLPRRQRRRPHQPHRPRRLRHRKGRRHPARGDDRQPLPGRRPRRLHAKPTSPRETLAAAPGEGCPQASKIGTPRGRNPAARGQAAQGLPLRRQALRKPRSATPSSPSTS